MGIVEIFLGTKYGYSGVNMQYNNNTENQEEYQRERKKTNCTQISHKLM